MKSGREGSGRLSLVFLYEDDWLIVVDKPAGLPVIVPDGGRTRNALDLVSARIRRTNPRGRAALVHRLDRDTSGVMVFARTSSAKRTLMSDWNALVTSRTYIALVEGDMGGLGGKLDSWLLEDRTGCVRTVRPGIRGALRAITNWRLLGRGQGCSLLELELETGRRHQIRAQLSSLGHPVAGDMRYGSRWNPVDRLALHASLIALSHPATGASLRFESKAPPSFLSAMERTRRHPRADRQ